MPTPQQEQQFASLMQSGNYAGAASYARSLGYSDADIANYVGNVGFQDQSGARISEQAAQQELARQQQAQALRQQEALRQQQLAEERRMQAESEQRNIAERIRLEAEQKAAEETAYAQAQGGALTQGASMPTQPTAQQEAEFRNLIQNGDFSKAAQLGRGLGFSDADIANYVGANAIRDNSGALVTANAAQSYLSANKPTTTQTTPVGALTTTTQQPTAVQEAQFKAMMDAGNYTGAAAIGRALGYTDAQIANYVGNKGFSDSNGKITETQAATALAKPTNATQQPNSAQAAIFAAMMAAGNFEGAAAVGRALGYNNSQIANYVGNVGFNDGTGRISESQALSYLEKPAAPVPTIAPTRPTTTGQQDTIVPGTSTGTPPTPAQPWTPYSPAQQQQFNTPILDGLYAQRQQTMQQPAPQFNFQSQPKAYDVGMKPPQGFKKGGLVDGALTRVIRDC